MSLFSYFIRYQVHTDIICIGGILLLIRRMTATFGKLQGNTLELSPGLNILEAPNETGKSTWCAFLLSMLYGINSRERDRTGFIADKNRYMPWNGGTMSGRLECRAGNQELTLLRTTRRATAPLGEFQATYTGTGDLVPGLTGPTCGELLLGISREVYERSAFIRQSGLAISQDAGLERRIASLISSGEEDTSFSEATEVLKKQLNRRRHNKTGQIPALEAELAEVRRQIEDARHLEQTLKQALAQVDTLAQQEALLQAELAHLDSWEAQQKQKDLVQAQQAAQEAKQRADTLRGRLEAEHIPENDTIARLRGAIVNLETVRKSVDKARAERDEAMKQMLRAEAAVSESPFAGQSVEQVRREVASPPSGTPSYTAAAVLAVCGLLAAAALCWGLWSMGPLPALGCSAAAVLASAGGAWALRRAARQKAQADALLKRYGTTDTDAITALANTYYKLYEAQEAAQANVNAKTATADALYATLTSNEQGILLEVRRFAPAAYNIPTADTLLRQCAVRRRELQEADAAAREAAMRRDLTAGQVPAAEESSAPLSPPARSRDAVTLALEDIRGQLSAARSTADQLSGRLHAGGDPVVLQSEAARLENEIHTLETEYDAIAMAMEVLDQANTTLQNRFSPALGRRAAEIFRAMTADRYGSVTLDRSLHLTAETTTDGLYRDASLLSAGTVDQLYLAVRLAICDLVLPNEDPAPIVLDDALSNFDDARAHAALRWLKDAARNRQILLFACQSREASFFASDPEVSIQRLTDAAEVV